MNENEKIEILTLIHIDNFLLKTKMNISNYHIKHVICKDITNIINKFKNNFSNFRFVTTNINFVDEMNKELDLLNIKDKCIYVECVCEFANKLNQDIIIIGNDSFYSYNERLDKIKSIIINTYNYNIRYKHDNIIYEKKNFCCFIENENLYEKI